MTAASGLSPVICTFAIFAGSSASRLRSRSASGEVRTAARYPAGSTNTGLAGPSSFANRSCPPGVTPPTTTAFVTARSPSVVFSVYVSFTFANGLSNPNFAGSGAASAS